tara:strand:+ start:286 stop:504 length:219 start_codon:yes stop_codon:yes gene_type:complete
MIEIIGWVGFVNILLGYLLNARKQLSCFYFWALGNIILIVYATLINSNPQIAIAIICLIMNIYGYKEWSRKK